MERGPDLIENTLRGGHMIFDKLTLPIALPDDLDGFRRVHERWLGRIVASDRPAYVGGWNATAMFMIALASRLDVAAQQKDRTPYLPLGGGVLSGLRRLYDAHLLSEPPSETGLDDYSFEPGVLAVNNGLMARLVSFKPDMCMLDVHAGLYMLGTGSPETDKW